jgi:hypothetical protein
VSLSCPHCKSTDVVASAWQDFCLHCQRLLGDAPPVQVPDVDPGVDRPVRPGHSLISSAAATVYEDNTDPNHGVDPLRRQRTLGVEHGGEPGAPTPPSAPANPEPPATGETTTADEGSEPTVVVQPEVDKVEDTPPPPPSEGDAG